MVMRQVDEDLAIFLGIKNGEKERNELVQIHNFEEFDASTSDEPKPDTLLAPHGLGEEAFQIVGDDNLLDLETGKSDHDWLYAQQDVDEQDGAANQAEIWNGECISLNSELANVSVESAPPAESALQLTTSKGSDSSVAAAANKRPAASSGGRKPAPRAATPTRRPALPAKTKPSRASTPTPRAPSRATATSSKPVPAQVRSSTPSRATPCASSSKPVSRSSTPSRATSRSSTPGSKTTVPASSKPALRSATPTRKPATPSSTISSKTGSVGIKNHLVPTRGGSQTVKSRPSNPSEMLSVSHDAPQTLKKSLPRRPASASRGRPSAPASLSCSSKGKPRQKSCSPTKVRATHRNGSTALSRSRGYSHGGGDDVNPVLMGTKMVERVVNMRKLAPPKQDEHISLENPKKSSSENSGFGRSLSKRSLDMAIRHMDIRRSVSGNLKPVATSVLSYFSSGNQSSSSQSSSFGISESPITSSSESSKSSNGDHSYFLDGRRMDD